MPTVTCSSAASAPVAAPAATAPLRARVITDEGGLVFGVVVRLTAAMSEAQARSHAIAALQARDDLPEPDARDCLARMRSTVQPYRWVPRDDGGGVRPHLEDADAGSRGSWLGMYWSYP